MTNSAFTIEQVESLISNKFVAKVTNSSIKFTEEFKEVYLKERKQGSEPISIYSKFGIDYEILGKHRIKSNEMRFFEQSKRMEKFSRKKGSGRPRNREFESDKEEVEYLRNELEYTKQENMFLKKLEELERGVSPKYPSKKNSK